MAKYGTNLDLNTNQLQNAVLQPLSADPGAVEARIYYNSTGKVIKYHNGTTWVTLGVSGSVDVSNAINVLTASHGGTGVANNNASTLTISGNYATTLNLSGITSVTLPTTGTLATLAGSETFTNKTITGLTLSAGTNTVDPLTFTSGVVLTTPIAGAMEFVNDTLSFTITTGPTRKTIAFTDSTLTGTWNGTVITGQYGGTGVANTGKTITLGGNLTTTGAFNTSFTQQGSFTFILPPQAGTLISTGDTGTVTNTMLAGSIANAKLLNSTITIGTTSTALGATSASLAGVANITHIAGTTAIAPITLTSGALLTTPVAGSFEFVTDTLSFTITTGTARKTIAFTDSNITGTASKATNLVGAAWSIPYQSATDTTSMLAQGGTLGKVLISGANNAAPQWTGGTLTLPASGSLTIPAFAVSFANAFATTGAFSTTLNVTGITSVTLPTSGTLMANPMTTLGDMITGGASGAPTRLAGSTTNGIYVLSATTAGSVAGAPSWILATGTGNNVLATSPTIATPTFTGGVTFSTGTSSVSSGATLNIPSGASFTVASGATFTSANTPVNPTDITNKQYVDSIAIGLTDWKASVRVATTANVTLSGSAPNVVDGVTLAANDRILVKNQTAPAENAIYYVSTLGTGANGTWTRATDADTSAKVTSGMYVYVEEGTAANKGQYVLNTPNPITLGTTGLTFVRFNGGSTLTAGNGIDITGDAVSFKVGGSTTYTANGVLFASSTSAIGQVTEVANANRPLVSAVAGAPVFSSLTLTNNAATLTLAASSSLITTGAFATTLAASASVTHTLPGEASKLAFIASATTPAANQIAYFDTTTGRLANLAVNSTATNKFLTQVSSGAPAWNALTSGDVTGGLGYTPTKKFVQAVTGAGPSYGPYTHGLGSADITVTVVDDTGSIIIPDVAITSTTITLTYGIGAPTAVTHRLIAVG